MRLLSLPIPIFAAIAVPLQIDPPAGTPAYVTGAFAGIWLVLWYLREIGKLPGAGGTADRREASFKDEDRAKVALIAEKATLAAEKASSATETLDMMADQVHEVHRIITREDVDKPGWLMVWRSSRESHDLREAVAKLAALADSWIKDRDDWRRDREEWRQDKAELLGRITRLEEIVRTQERALERGTA